MPQQDSVGSPATDQDFEIYKTLRDYEEHFNRTQVEVKKLASGWMLATFGAMAVIVRGDLSTTNSLLDSGSLLVIIGLAGNIGLLSLWILDQLVNQRLLGAAFRVGVLLERSNPQLPPIRSKMWLNSDSHGVGRHHALFYVCPMAFNFFVATIYGLSRSPAQYFWYLLIGAIAAGAITIPPARQWVKGPAEPASEEETAAIKRTVSDWESRHQGPGDLAG